MKRFKVLLIIIILGIFVISFIGAKGSLIQDLEIPIGAGVDLEEHDENIFYNVHFLVYSFGDDNQIKSNIYLGKGSSLGQTRQDRQLKMGKKSMIGLNRIFLFSKKSAMFGIDNFLDMWANNSDINDRALCAVCRERAEDILKYKVSGYSNSSEYIEGMIKNLQQYNFFPMQYTLMDLIVRDHAEGRNILLPYLEIKGENIETTGLAIFKEDKMVGKADMNEARVINILKENGLRGMLTLQKDPVKYIDCYTYSKRKIQCYKENEKYKFIINLNLKGKIVSDELYNNLHTNPQMLKKFEKDMESHVEKICNETVNNIKCKYKTDILDLGRIAIAKYGRNTGTDWNKAICDSDIKINVKFTVDTEGRGNY